MKPTAQIGAVPVMRGPRIQSSPDRVGRRNDRFSIQAGPGERAFSLIEIMVTVGLLSFIILGLLAMFNQTQRAFKSSITQTDVLEAGRATMDMLGRELEQMSPSEAPDYLFGNVRTRATNFFVEFTPGFWPFSAGLTPLSQELPGSGISRTNVVQRFFFLSKLNQDLMGIGYEVIPDDASGFVGSLYRFAGTNFRSGPVNLSAEFLKAASVSLQNAARGLPVTNVNGMAVNRISDGVVHLRARAFARNGFMLTWTNSILYSNVFALTTRGPFTNVQNTAVYGVASADPIQGECYFMSNALPAYVEVELGILEPQVLRRYRSIESPAAQLAYLTNHAAQVHLFRQRIPVRNLDSTAYP
jgi:type II secretory pathway pseudopilin PulG